MPPDLDLPHIAAILLIFLLWCSYSTILRLFGHGSLNAQLHVVRQQWMRNVMASSRENRVIDGLILGHISGQMSFFGSATLIVLAGLVGTLAGIGHVHTAMEQLPFLPQTSLSLFTLHFSVLTLIMAMTFFSFTYALRKLAYTLAMIGGLPVAPSTDEYSQVMIDQTATVLTESVKSLNFGIRGFYFSIAALFLFAGPTISLCVTLLVSGTLFWRQGFSETAQGIERYVEAMNKRNAAS